MVFAGVEKGVPELAGPRRVCHGIVDSSDEAEGADDPEDAGDGPGDRRAHRKGPIAPARLEGEARTDGDGNRTRAPDGPQQRRPGCRDEGLLRRPNRAPSGEGAGRKHEHHRDSGSRGEHPPIGVRPQSGVEPAREPNRESGR